MKRKILEIAIGIIGILCTPNTLKAECEPVEKSTVEIPIVFEFKNQFFRNKWVYNSLESNLKLSNKSYNQKPQSSIVNNGRLELTFCVEEEDFSELNTELKINFASRSFTVIARPVQWEKNVITKNKQDLEIKRGKMPVINFVNQPDPDWIILKNAELLYTPNGTPRIDIYIYNSTLFKVFNMVHLYTSGKKIGS